MKTFLFGALYIFLLPLLIFAAVGHLAVENIAPAVSKCFILLFDIESCFEISICMSNKRWIIIWIITWKHTSDYVSVISLIK